MCTPHKKEMSATTQFLSIRHPQKFSIATDTVSGVWNFRRSLNDQINESSVENIGSGLYNKT
jgi:hypothetical protein